MVEASAGTGKTFAITRLVLRLLLRREAPLALPEIAVVTFTEKGTNELITRIREVLRLARDICSDNPLPGDTHRDLVDFLLPQREWATERIGEALAAIDQLSVSTIHGFCRRILTELALEAGDDLLLALLVLKGFTAVCAVNRFAVNRKHILDADFVSDLNHMQMILPWPFRKNQY